MPRMKENSRIVTYNKLSRIGKASEKEIQKLQIEDLQEITNDIDVKNIILLRQNIKNKTILDYFDFMKEEVNLDGK